MFIYNYHPITKEFLSISLAKINPLETEKQKKKVYLIPSNATLVKPERELEKVPVWTGDSWDNAVDKRGVKYFLKGSLDEHEISVLGEDLPEDALSELDLETVKENASSKANIERKKFVLKLQDSFEVNALGNVWDFSLRTVSLFTGLITLNNSFEWRPKDEESQILTIQEAKEIGIAIRVKLRQIDQASEKDKAAIINEDYSNSNLKNLLGE